MKISENREKITWTRLETSFNGCHMNATLETVKLMSHGCDSWNRGSTNEVSTPWTWPSHTCSGSTNEVSTPWTWPSHTCSGSPDRNRRHSFGRTTSRGWRSSTARPLSSYTPSEWRHEVRSDTASPDSGRDDSSPGTIWRTKRTIITKGRTMYLFKQNTCFSNKTPWKGDNTM